MNNATLFYFNFYKFNYTTPNSNETNTFEFIEAVSCRPWLAELYGNETADEMMESLDYSSWLCPKTTDFDLLYMNKVFGVNVSQKEDLSDVDLKRIESTYMMTGFIKQQFDHVKNGEKYVTELEFYPLHPSKTESVTA